jgi:hypothetical protein
MKEPYNGPVIAGKVYFDSLDEARNDLGNLDGLKIFKASKVDALAGFDLEDEIENHLVSQDAEDPSDMVSDMILNGLHEVIESFNSWKSQHRWSLYEEHEEIDAGGNEVKR